MISMKAKYAIHALVCMASRPPETSFVAWKIAQVENIPQKFLEEILLDLRKEGILRSKTGKSGGYFLQVAPANVKLTHIFQAINDPLVTNARLNSGDRFNADRQDLIDPIRARLAAAQNRVLESITLADLVQIRQEQLMQTLNSLDFQI